MFGQLRDTLQLDDHTWNDYMSCFKRMDVAARAVLLNEVEAGKAAASVHGS